MGAIELNEFMAMAERSRLAIMEIAEKDYSHKWYVMAAVSMGLLLATIDGSIVKIC